MFKKIKAFIKRERDLICTVARATWEAFWFYLCFLAVTVVLVAIAAIVPVYGIYCIAESWIAAVKGGKTVKKSSEEDLENIVGNLKG